MRRAKAPHPSRGQTRLATVVPAILLSSELCSVGRERPCRATWLAGFTQHNSSLDLASRTPLRRGFRLACPTLRLFVRAYGGATGVATHRVTDPLAARCRPVHDSRKQVEVVQLGARLCKP